MKICRFGGKASCDFRASCFGEKLISAHTLRDAVVHSLQSLNFRAALCTRKHCIAERMQPHLSEIQRMRSGCSFIELYRIRYTRKSRIGIESVWQKNRTSEGRGFDEI